MIVKNISFENDGVYFNGEVVFDGVAFHGKLDVNFDGEEISVNCSKSLEGMSIEKIDFDDFGAEILTECFMEIVDKINFTKSFAEKLNIDILKIN